MASLIFYVALILLFFFDFFFFFFFFFFWMYNDLKFSWISRNSLSFNCFGDYISQFGLYDKFVLYC